MLLRSKIYFLIALFLGMSMAPMALSANPQPAEIAAKAEQELTDEIQKEEGVSAINLALFGLLSFCK